MMKRINFDSVGYKDWIGLAASPVFWIASLICFVLGLSFKTTDYSVMIPGTSISLVLLFSIGIGFANTAIQIVGNDTDKEDLGMALVLMWGASYLIGIGSNVNFLYSVIALSNPLLQAMVCYGLGIMIEVAPERLLVKFLRAAGIISDKGAKKREYQEPQRNQDRVQQNNPPHKSQQGGGESREQRHQRMLRESGALRGTEKDLPDFLREKMGNIG